MSHLKSIYIWPEQKPDIEFNDGGWFPDCNKEVLKKYISPETKIIVELGSWLGLSTRWLLENAPNATVIAIDHWKGSPENEKDPILPMLYETFLSNCWAYRDRLIPVKETTRYGLYLLKQFDINPDIAYVDAGHDYDSAKEDIFSLLNFNCRLIGDDFNPISWPGVTQAVWEAAIAVNADIEIHKSCWSFKS